MHATTRLVRLSATVFACVALLGFASGCDSDGDSDPTATSVAGTSVPTTPEPHPEPTITGSQFTFPARGYEVRFPDGWLPDANSLIAGPLAIDTFFSPAEIEGVTDNISVTCNQQSSPPATLDQFVANRLEAIGASNAHDISETQTLIVSDMEARRVDYSLTRESVTLRTTEVMLVNDRCAWALKLATRPASAEANRATFDSFVSSFRLF